MFTKRFLSSFLLLATTLGMFAQVPNYAPTIGLQFWCGFNGTLLPDLGVDTVNVSQNTPDEFAMDRIGGLNRALLFNSSPDNVTINSILSPNPFTGTSDGLSVSLWYKVSADSSRAILAQCYDDENVANGGWRITWNSESLNSSFIEATYRNGSVDSCSVTADVTTDFYGWHMVTFIVNGDGAQLYLDDQLSIGTPWSTAPSLLPEAFPEPIYVGNYSGNPTPNTAFAGKIDDVAVWNRTLTAAEVSLLYSGTQTIAGCTNSNSCTFNEGVTIDDGTCAFFCQGCMDPCACNYDQNAIDHIAESCVYDCIVDTVVLRAFLDLNNDGSFNTDEGPLANRPIVFSGPDAATVYTDSEGMFVLPVRTGEYAFEIIPYDFWANPSENPLNPLQQNRTFPNAEPDTMTFAFGPEATVQPSAEVDSISTYNYFFSCSFGYGGGVSVVNTGNEAISGTIILTCNPELLPEPDSLETISPDSVALGYAEWNIDTLLPGATALYTFHVDFAPELIEGFFFDLDVQLDSENQPGLVSEVFSLSPQLNCDILPAGLVMAEPEGVGDQNYISAGETVRYRVYYRNDGPGGIDSVRVSVNLNSDQMLLETLNFPYNPVEYVRCLHDDGTIDFVRSAEFIPDTTESNIDAIGYIVFDIQLRDDLEHNELVIVSPTIALNDTVIIPEPFVHTIFQCEVLEGLDNLYLIDTAYILIEPDSGTTFAIDLCASEVNSLIPLNYSWTYPGGAGDSCAIAFETNGPNEVPDLFDLTLTISNADLGCNETSVVSVAIPVEEFDASHNIQAYPNPFENRCTVVFTEKFNTIVLYNSLGELIRSWSNQPSSIEIDHNQLSSGAYYLVAHSEQRTARKILIAE
jgi:hypothetical protein